MSTPVFVYSQWLLFAVLLAFLVLWAVAIAKRDLWDALRWRFVKLVATALGVVGLAVFFVNIELTARESIWGDADRMLAQEFLDTKLLITREMIKHCQHGGVPNADKNTCWDITNLDGQIHRLNIETRKPFRTLENWQNNPAISDLVDDLNRRISLMNSLIPKGRESFSVLTGERRLKFMFLAGLAIVLALAGSIGEAYYQYEQEKRRQLKTEAGLKHAEPIDASNSTAPPPTVT